MNCLILGSSGMIGSGLLRYFPKFGINATGVARNQFDVAFGDGFKRLSQQLHAIPGFLEADTVVNCIGIVKQLTHLHRDGDIFYINSVFPGHLSEICHRLGKVFVNLSTDCVFSGKAGNYCELSIPDSKDLYGLSKSSGENIKAKSIVVRTSTIGIEADGYHGLLEWYLRSKERVLGFSGSVYSGVSLNELARSIAVLLKAGVTSGLYQVSSDPITKCDLLTLFHIHGLGVKVTPHDSKGIDRSLDDQKFRDLTGLTRRCWPEMVFDIMYEVERYGNQKKQSS